ncbi:MAG: WD40/YVTN/BNR-like repeat-containing protein [Candidatus Limnocylindrales bacterium]
MRSLRSAPGFVPRLALLTIAVLIAAGCAAQGIPSPFEPGTSAAASSQPNANEIAGVGLVAPAAASAPAWQVAWISPSVQLTGLVVFDPDHAWAAGSDGMLYAWDGTGWHVQRVAHGIALLAAADRRHAWIAGDDGIRYWNGEQWRLTSTDGAVTALAALDARHAWAASPAGIAAWTGSDWQLTPGGRDAVVHGIAAADGSHAWAVGSLSDGQGVVLAWNGSAWHMQAVLPDPLVSVYAADPRHVWAVSPSGTVYAWDGKGWRLDTNLHQPLTDITGADGGQLWVTSASGQIWTLQGGRWGIVYRAPTTLLAITSLGSTNVWAIGFDTVYSTEAALQTPSSASAGLGTGF